MPYQQFSVKYNFPNLTEERYAAFAADAELQIDDLNWGSVRPLAIDLIVGHLLTLADSSFGSQVQSVTVAGERSVTFASNSGGWSATWYGQEYERLKAKIGKSKGSSGHYGGDRTEPEMKW